MSKHFEAVATMKALALARQEPVGVGVESNPRSASKDDTWQILLYLLHMADISGQAKPHNLSMNWSDRVMEEFFQQGDEEAALGMPISFLCDRATVNVPESQFGYVNFVVKPAFEVVGMLVPEAEMKVLPYVEKNLEYWEMEKEKNQNMPVVPTKSAPPESAQGNL